MGPPYQQPGAQVVFWVWFGLFVVGEYAMQIRSWLHRRGLRHERWSLASYARTSDRGSALRGRLIKT